MVAGRAHPADGRVAVPGSALRYGAPVAAPTLILREAPEARPKGPRPLDRVRLAIRARHYSRRTEEAYVRWVRRFVLFHCKRHPLEMGEAEISAFLSHLAVRGRVSASTQGQALSAPLFLYKHVLGRELAWMDGIVRAKAPRRLPVVLTREEVRAVLDQLTGVHRLMATLLYGAGLRLLECARLRVKDVDFGRSEILVPGGKGNRDRRTMLPAGVKPLLQRHLDEVRRQYEQDLKRGEGWVELPGALALKYPSAGRDRPWQWVFPATRWYVDAATGQRRRHHLHETVCCSGPFGWPSRPRSPNLRAATACDTPSPPTCSRTATTSGRCRSCSDTATSAPL